VISDRNAMSCLVHQAEQLLSLERWPDREVKSWSQPDGGIVGISSSHVVGIGICPGIGPVPSSQPAAEASRDPLAWSAAVITDVQALVGSAVEELGRPPRITVQADYVAAGVLYGAPVDPSASAGGPAWRQSPDGALQPWPAGRYRITYVFPGDPQQVTRTVVVEITTPRNGG
jgi:hypothetical protein